MGTATSTSTSTSTSTHEHEREHEHEHEHGHDEHEPSNTTEEQQDPLPHSPFLSMLWLLIPRAKYIIIRCMVFHEI